MVLELSEVRALHLGYIAPYHSPLELFSKCTIMAIMPTLLPTLFNYEKTRLSFIYLHKNGNTVMKGIIKGYQQNSMACDSNET